MRVYDLDVVTLDDNEINFEIGKLYHHDDEAFQSWEVELIGINNDGLIHSLMDKQEHIKVKMGGNTGQGFIGMALITNFNVSPRGSQALLAGSGELREV